MHVVFHDRKHAWNYISMGFVWFRWLWRYHAAWSPPSWAEIKALGDDSAGCTCSKRYEGKKQCGPPCPERHDVSLPVWEDATLATAVNSTSLRLGSETMFHESWDSISRKRAMVGSLATSAAISEASTESLDQRFVNSMSSSSSGHLLRSRRRIRCTVPWQHELSRVSNSIMMVWSSGVSSACLSKSIRTCWKDARRPLMFSWMPTTMGLLSGNFTCWNDPNLNHRINTATMHHCICCTFALAKVSQIFKLICPRGGSNPSSTGLNSCSKFSQRNFRNSGFVATRQSKLVAVITAKSFRETRSSSLKSIFRTSSRICCVSSWRKSSSWRLSSSASCSLA